MTRNIKTTKNIKQDKSHKIESYMSKEHKRIGDKIITQTKKTREEQIKWNKNVKKKGNVISNITYQSPRIGG